MAMGRKGHSLVRFIDLEQERQIRAWLRQPKKTKPGLTHALHWLWDAYLELEAENWKYARHERAIKDVIEGA